MLPMPQSREAEMAVLGCCISDPVKCIPESQLVIRSADYFYDLRNQIIWEVICGLELASVDLVSIQQKLKDRNMLDEVGGIAHLNACQDLVPSTANLAQYLSFLEDKAILRNLIGTCTGIIESAQLSQSDVTKLLDSVERDILAIRPSQRKSDDIKALTNQAIAKMEAVMNAQGAITGMTTGLQDLDRLTDGVHGGEMVVVAGYTSTGKTALAVNVATANAILGIPVLIFTAEMLPVQIVIRQLCSTAKANWKRLVESDVPSLTMAAGLISKAPIHVEPANGLTAGQVLAIARRKFQRHKIRLIVVDYIQLLSGNGDNREQQIASISKVMKAMALELDCAVLALSQLTDDGKLRESRAIGHDADSVWKLENDGEWQPKIQPIKLNVEKCRDGETGQVKLTFMKEFTKFENQSKIDEGDYPHANLRVQLSDYPKHEDIAWKTFLIAKNLEP